MRIYLGHDPREEEALRVALKTLKGKSGLEAELLRADRLRDAGLLSRISDHRGGQAYDLVSNAPKSTAFAVSRFLTPILCQGGYALFVDCDVVFLRNPLQMLLEIEPGKAVYVVKHGGDYKTGRWKMDGQTNDPYPRKWWSSVMLFDCDHPANRRLSLYDINTRPGRDLHRFYWLHDDEIGSLDQKWNWLVGVSPKPDEVGIAHFTLGGKWIPGWVPQEHDEIWTEAAR